jgi:predicted NAD/FAD-binding protein
MPSNPNAWASWNVIRSRQSDTDSPVTLTYHMNRLQQLRTLSDYLVTLNPFRPIDEKRIVAQVTYTHPIYTFESLRTQQDLAKLNGERNTVYCGSYFGYGFHEDAARSGFEAAVVLGADHGF